MKRDEIGAVCSMYEGDKNLQKMLLAEPEGKITPGTHRCKWKVNIKMNKIDLNEIGYGMKIWRALVDAIINLLVPQKAGKSLSI
jgi:hypothetical protein